MTRRAFVAGSLGSDDGGAPRRQARRSRRVRRGRRGRDAARSTRWSATARSPRMCEMCVWRCGVRAKVRDGRVVKLDGNPDHPHSRGKLCPRGQSGLMTDLRPRPRAVSADAGGRARQRASGSASPGRKRWTTSPSRCWSIKQTVRPGGDDLLDHAQPVQVQFENLLNALRLAQLRHAAQPVLQRHDRRQPDDLRHGRAGARLRGRELHHLHRAQPDGGHLHLRDPGPDATRSPAGAKVVVCDPRFTKTAAKATEWLPIKPGTDLAFLLALLNVVIGRDGYDAEFVAKYTVGFDELAAADHAVHARMGGAQVRHRRRDHPRASPANSPPRAPRLRAPQLAHLQLHQLLPDRARHRHPQRPGRQLGHSQAASATSPARGDGSGLGAPPQPPYPRIAALRLDGVPWKYPLVPLKLGIFQDIARRDARPASPTRRAAGSSPARTRC